MTHAIISNAALNKLIDLFDLFPSSRLQSVNEYHASLFFYKIKKYSTILNNHVRISVLQHL